MPASKSRLRILSRIKTLVLNHHFNIGNLDLVAWCKEVDIRSPTLLRLDDNAFEEGVHDLLGQLRSSHIDFYRNRRNPTKPEHSIGATLRPISVLGRQHWMFLDVFDESPAEHAGVIPGQVLVSVDGTDIGPPELPHFGFGRTHELQIRRPDEERIQKITIAIPALKSTRPRLPFIQPKALAYRMLTDRIGLIRIAFFSGMLGFRFSRILDDAMASLKDQGCDRLILDLRGCLGGSLGFARLASYMCPGRIPMGYDVTGKRQRSGYDASSLPKIEMPNTRLGAAARLLQFFFRDKSLVLLTQGLGKQPFHGRIAILINECTSSAGEMVAQFAKDANLATLIGRKTPGLVLGSTTFGVGDGYTLYLPVFGWFRLNGSYVEGLGVEPDIPVDVDPVSLVQGHDAQLHAAIEILLKDTNSLVIKS